MIPADTNPADTNPADTNPADTNPADTNPADTNPAASNPAETPRQAPSVALEIEIGRLRLPNPVLVASGTFGYGREMEKLVDLSRLGAIIPKTVTPQPRVGNSPWRTVETAAGLLNSIGLDNDGIDAFLAHHLPYLSRTGSPLIVSLAGRNPSQYAEMAVQVEQASAREVSAGGAAVAAIELNVSCPNVSGGVDYGADAHACRDLVRLVRDHCGLPLLAKLTPNVTRIVDIAGGAAAGGADGVCLINTVLGMAVDWKGRRPLLGNVMGGLSGPAIKPIALRCVHQVATAVDVPIVGIGGIGCLDDAMEFLVTGASAIQIGTANYYRPRVSMEILEQLPAAIRRLGAASVAEVVGTLSIPPAA